MSTEQMTRDIIAVAQRHNIEPAAMLAVVEVETNGRAVEAADSTVPRFLFERHIFHRELSKRAPGKLAAAVAAGLAHPQWLGSPQYADQRTSDARLALLARARAIDVECANRSCSWGLGQTMGFNAESLGFASASQMLAFLQQGGVQAQLEVMVRFIRNQNLIGALNAHDWERFARVYNGAGFKKNQYDTKLAAAYARWRAKLGSSGGVVLDFEGPRLDGVLTEGAEGAAVRALQERLAALNYPVGKIDGVFGRLTRSAVLAFQDATHLPLTGTADKATMAALAAAQPRDLSDARKNATEEDLRKAGSKTIELVGWLRKVAVGTGLLGGLGLSDQYIARFLDGVQYVLTGTGPVVATTAATVTPAVAKPAGKAVLPVAVATPPQPELAGPLFDLLKGAIAAPSGGLSLLTIGAAVLLWRNAQQIAQQRVQDHRTGKNLGM